MKKLIKKIKYQFINKPCFEVTGRFFAEQTDKFLSDLMKNSKTMAKKLGVKISGYCDGYNIDFVVWSDKIRVNEEIRKKVVKEFDYLSDVGTIEIGKFIEQSEVFEDIK